MAGIDLTNDRRSQLLQQLLAQQGQQPQIQSGAELFARLGEQLIRQQTINKQQEQEAGVERTRGSNQDALIAAITGQPTQSVFGTDLPENTNVNQAMSQLPTNDPLRGAVQDALIKKEFAAPVKSKIGQKEVKSGDEIITFRTVDGKLGEELFRAPRKQVSEVTTFNGSVLTKSAISKQVVDAREATKQVARQIRQATRSVEIAQADPASIGIPGNLVTFGNNMVQTAKSLGSLFRDKDGKPVDVGADRSIDGFDYSGLRSSAVNNAEFRAGVFGIAFAAAVATQGSRPTDKDIQAFIDQIAGSSSDPVAFARTINGFTKLTVQSLRDTVSLNPEIDDKEAERIFSVIDPLMDKFNEQIAGADAARLKEMGF